MKIQFILILEKWKKFLFSTPKTITWGFFLGGGVTPIPQGCGEAPTNFVEVF